MRHRRGAGAAIAAIALLVSATLLLGVLETAPAQARTLRGRILHRINAARDRHDLRPLALNRTLSRDARQHTGRMVRRNRLFHSAFLPDALSPYDWHMWGENVGCAPTVRRLHRSFMRSAFHRANILEPGFRLVAIGVVRLTVTRDTCGWHQQIWVTEIFYG